jgi:outer membrane lipoprotein-sorting protein
LSSVVALLFTVAALSPPPTGSVDVAAFVRRYDEVMAPAAYEGAVQMTAWREDGTSRNYKMRILKAGADKVRLTFEEPKSAVGQEMLRQGDNLWVYMPNLKRAVRLASRDSFMGGDFNNADVLRPNWQVDYNAAFVREQTGEITLDLKARTADAAWDRVLLWMTAGDPKKSQPVRAEFYAASGKLLRSVQFVGTRDFGGGVVRPTSITIKNEIVPARRSELTWDSLTLKNDISPQRFVIDDLGR